jgi:hypothetical protein
MSLREEMAAADTYARSLLQRLFRHTHLSLKDSADVAYLQELKAEFQEAADGGVAPQQMAAAILAAFPALSGGGGESTD